MSLLSRCTPRYTLFPYTTLFRSASGTNSIGDAYKAVQRGDVDYIITGGTESPLTNMAFAGFSSMKALSQNDDPKDRKSTRLNSSHVASSYAVFCMKKKTKAIVQN